MDLLVELASEIIKEQREELLVEYPSVDLNLDSLEDPEVWRRHTCRRITPEEQMLWPDAETVFEMLSDDDEENVQIDIFTQGLSIYGSRITVNGV